MNEGNLVRKILTTIVGAGLLAAAWVFVAPQPLGGPTSMVITSGNSMEPKFHSGDMVIVREADDYDVGDVVAYRSEELNSVVLHRIIARTATGSSLPRRQQRFRRQRAPGTRRSHRPSACSHPEGDHPEGAGGSEGHCLRRGDHRLLLLPQHLRLGRRGRGRGTGSGCSFGGRTLTMKLTRLLRFLDPRH